jgi:hypothetical protein
MEYVCADVRVQRKVWVETGDSEGRIDRCTVVVGIPKAYTDCLEYTGNEFEVEEAPCLMFFFSSARRIMEEGFFLV